MKKLILVFSAVALIFSSCSSDNDAPTSTPDTAGSLLKKIVVTDVDGTRTENYTYNGNKIVSIVDGQGYVENYTYTGDLITSTRESENGTLLANNVFEYNANGDLVTYKRSDETGEFLRDGYVYNTDGTITINHYDTYQLNSSNQPYIIYETEKLFFTNGEITKIESENLTLGDGVHTKNYTYDTKNNPYKNIVGYSKFIYGEHDLDHGGKSRNFLSKTPLGSPATETCSYTYNTNDYPATHRLTDSNGEVETAVYSY